MLLDLRLAEHDLFLHWRHNRTQSLVGLLPLLACTAKELNCHQLQPIYSAQSTHTIVGDLKVLIPSSLRLQHPVTDSHCRPALSTLLLLSPLVAPHSQDDCHDDQQHYSYDGQYNPNRRRSTGGFDSARRWAAGQAVPPIEGTRRADVGCIEVVPSAAGEAVVRVVAALAVLDAGRTGVVFEEVVAGGTNIAVRSIGTGGT
jgi:hypothetical protein